MTLKKQRLIALVMIVIGLVVPRIIDAYETANHLDIKRDIGVLPWWIMAGVGGVWLAWSFFGSRS